MNVEGARITSNSSTASYEPMYRSYECSPGNMVRTMLPKSNSSCLDDVGPYRETRWSCTVFFVDLMELCVMLVNLQYNRKRHFTQAHKVSICTIFFPTFTHHPIIHTT